MKIHHLNTGTMCPMGRRLVNGSGSLFQRARLVCHCLLVETNDGLALVDTGIGLGDIAAPDRMGRRWVRQTAPKFDPAETAVEQVRALGYSPKDVRHVLLTHLDRDHAGGVPDFPHAAIHVHRAEYDMAVLRKPAPPEGRYVTGQWSHGPRWSFYGEAGEDWFGFEGVRALGGTEADILLIPLAGHTLGHCGIAVRSGDTWLLHAGDSYFHHAQLDPSPRVPLMLGYFQRRGDMDRRMRIANQARLRALKRDHGDRVIIVNSHDPADYERCRCGRHQLVAEPNEATCLQGQVDAEVTNA